MLRATFLMEQHIGHYSYYANLRRFVDPAASIVAKWVPITYHEEGARSFPFLRKLQGPLTGRKQVMHGLRSPYDIAVFNTQVPAALALPFLFRHSYILCTDITPIQYDGMGKHYNHDPDKFAGTRMVKHKLNQRMFRGARRLLPWSSWTAESMVSDYGVARERIEILPPGVDTALWHPDPAQKVDDGKLKILFVGGDFFRKGGELLLEAFRRLPTGSAELHIATRSDIPAEDNVFVYHGMMPNSAELIQLYQRCDLFCLPTFAEAFGIVAIEASGAGLPVVATKIGGLTDIVIEGETGHLVPAGDVDALFAKLNALVEQPERCRTMGIAAREHAENKFDAQKNSQRMVKILEEVWQEVSNGDRRTRS